MWEPSVLIDLISRMEYAPDRTVEVRHRPTRWVLYVQLQDCFDTYHPNVRLTAHHNVDIPPVDLDEEWWLRWLVDALISVEAHEVREWFKIDGKRPFDPHNFGGALYETVRANDR